ncbi:helix-turn-helix domain-containing protein [Cupriavidus sp. KB_39]|uniref:helix-turn-helix domain-containing protein n=1 Tax=Cupriavidus sp. KB_39 TaxID=3233036 RepID=UPI003F907029
MNTTKRRELDPHEKDDIERLKALVAEARAKNPTLTQEKLAELCGWNSQGNVQNYLGARTPLNLDAAYRFAKALGVALDAISPRLAARAQELFGATEAANQPPPQTIKALLQVLHDEHRDSSEEVRIAIAELVKKYEENPEQGAMIAKLIRGLLSAS